MLQKISDSLYIDPQAAIPVGLCPICGGELWGFDSPCQRCGEVESHDPG